jgi:hypothetical protein
MNLFDPNPTIPIPQPHWLFIWLNHDIVYWTIVGIAVCSPFILGITIWHDWRERKRHRAFFAFLPHEVLDETGTLTFRKNMSKLKYQLTHVMPEGPAFIRQYFLDGHNRPTAENSFSWTQVWRGLSYSDRKKYNATPGTLGDNRPEW